MRLVHLVLFVGKSRASAALGASSFASQPFLCTGFGFASVGVSVLRPAQIVTQQQYPSHSSSSTHHTAAAEPITQQQQYPSHSSSSTHHTAAASITKQQHPFHPAAHSTPHTAAASIPSSSSQQQYLLGPTLAAAFCRLDSC